VRFLVDAAGSRYIADLVQELLVHLPELDRRRR